MKPLDNFFKSTLKSFTVFSLSSLAFILIICFFPLMGTITVANFPLKQAISDNFKLFIPLLIVCIIISPLIGWACSKIKKKRFIYLLLIGFVCNWFAIISVMLMMSNFTIGKEDIETFMLLSVWGLVTYSIFSLPLLTLAIFLIERWTSRAVQTNL